MIIFPPSVEEPLELNQVISEFLKQDLADAETPTGGHDLSLYEGRFPRWSWVQHRDKCLQVLPELSLMAADDGFEHYLTPLYEFVLYQSMREWIDVEQDAANGEDDEQHAREREERADRLEDWLEEAFQDLDFLNPGLLARVALERAELQQELDVDVVAYLELMPNDVRAEVERVLAVASKANQGLTPPPDGAKPSPS